ncbi:MAG: universal stress protein [Muribaculaceae bacterium]|nr:universal stress protein [Muribaculaceae bacterium]
MADGRLITVAIHTYDKAVALKALLENEGVEAVLQNVNLSDPVISSGVRVRIHEDDLPLALRIIENPEIFAIAPVSAASVVDYGEQILLLPVDFSERSFHSARVAFSIAAQHGWRVVFLHAYLVPRSSSSLSLANSLNFDVNQPGESQASIEIAKGAHEMMTSLITRVKSSIKRGEMPGVKFSSVLVEGVPEECIAQYIKENRSVRLIIMGTRAASRKAHDLAGSITAEVLDSCRVQALTVPEGDSWFNSLDDVKHVTLLSTLEQEDFLALDALNRLMPKGKHLDVKVICLPSNKYMRATAKAARSALGEYCNAHFPNYSFTLENAGSELDSLEQDHPDLIIVPNRKKIMLLRLFSPGLAHRILFHTDIPMMVIPV